MRGLLTESATTVAPATPLRYELDPQVALRPEPFGALAYHYGNRRLTFLRSPDLVALVQGLAAHESLDAALEASTIERRRWPSFRTAVAALIESEVVRVR